MLFSASPEKGKNYQDYYADGWLDKPFDKESIASKLDSQLKWLQTTSRSNRYLAGEIP